MLAVWRLSLSCPGYSIDAIAEQLAIYFVLETLACYSILWICLASYFSRRKIAILESVNRAGEEFNGLNRGLAAEIGARLSELKELHSSKDTPRRTSGRTAGQGSS
jgi:hypothetical protein